MNGKTDLLAKTLDNLFASQPAKKKKPKQEGELPPSLSDIELAATVILVDLASCDSNFEQSEYHLVFEGLNLVFGITAKKVQGLVNQATLILGNLRGTKRYSDMLRDNLDTDTKKLFLQAIEAIIEADGVQDDFEIYLKHKYMDALDIKPEQISAEKS